ncbi:hypothetical protein CbuK_1673 [Coxiella burnetii CbuK_Q154]|nr:hypothetical protein CbuK_1673 [Coxiella burnetii CbuK_Q154]
MIIFRNFFLFWFGFLNFYLFRWFFLLYFSCIFIVLSSTSDSFSS